MASQTLDTPTYVRLSEKQRARLNEIAASQQRTLSGEIRHAIERHITAVDERQAEMEQAA